MTIEECLRSIQGKAAMLEQLADAAPSRAEMMDAEAFAGMSETCVEIRRYARAAQDSLTAAALDANVRRPDQFN